MVSGSARSAIPGASRVGLYCISFPIDKPYGSELARNQSVVGDQENQNLFVFPMGLGLIPCNWMWTRLKASLAFEMTLSNTHIISM